MVSPAYWWARQDSNLRFIRLGNEGLIQLDDAPLCICAATPGHCPVQLFGQAILRLLVTVPVAGDGEEDSSVVATDGDQSRLVSVMGLDDGNRVGMTADRDVDRTAAHPAHNAQLADSFAKLLAEVRIVL